MKDVESIIVIAFLVLGIVIGTIIGKEIQKAKDHKIFAKTKCGQFSPITGKFEFIKEVKNEKR